jgi:hypothetical protein
MAGEVTTLREGQGEGTFAQNIFRFFNLKK